jgi:aspartyl/asparaginyl beta-hydroxylase (cupin superfamily)
MCTTHNLSKIWATPPLSRGQPCALSSMLLHLLQVYLASGALYGSAVSRSFHRTSQPVCAATVDGMATDRICTPGSLASRIEEAVCKVYGETGTLRVRHSLKALSDGIPLDRTLDASNELMVQQATSYIEDLTAKPWHDASTYKWAKKLEQKWTIVRDELRANLRDEAALEAAGNSVWGGLGGDIIDYGTDWKTLPLCDRTVWDATNAALFPKTCALLTKSKVPLIEAFFAKMPPETDIKPHSDNCNFVLTSHLGVEVPEGQCDITVGDGTVEWRNGKVLLFDTSILHKAENRAPTTRYILMMRVFHPELSAVERSALQLVFDTLDEPELLDDHEALSEYDMRRRALEAASRQAWEGKRR